MPRSIPGFTAGTYRGRTLRVALVRERRSYSGVTVACARDIHQFMHDLAREDRERFFVLPLTVKNEIVGAHEVSVGTLEATLVHPREVFKVALLANAASVALVHNHPSGCPEPSGEDHALTHRLVEAGELLGIPVLDHVVIGETGYVSFAERGAL